MMTRGKIEVLYAIQGTGDTGMEDIHCLMQHDDGTIEYIPLFTDGRYSKLSETDYDIIRGIEDVINRR